MIRGTNAKFTFQLPYNFDQLEKAKVVFWQPENDGPSFNRPLPIVKVLEQCCSGGKPDELCVTLNQEETLRFNEYRKAFVQLRAMTKDGIPVANKAKLITVYPVYDDSILDEEILPTPDFDGIVRLDGKAIV
jgi:hypothetical protein